MDSHSCLEALGVDSFLPQRYSRITVTMMHGRKTGKRSTVGFWRRMNFGLLSVFLVRFFNEMRAFIFIIRKIKLICETKGHGVERGRLTWALGSDRLDHDSSATCCWVTSDK